MLGIGKDVPLATGNGSEGLLALVDGKFLTFRVPYPMGFYAQGHRRPHRRSEGRLEGQGHLDDRTRRARRSTSKAARGRRSKLVKFQVRPDPLSK